MIESEDAFNGGNASSDEEEDVAWNTSSSESESEYLDEEIPFGFNEEEKEEEEEEEEEEQIDNNIPSFGRFNWTSQNCCTQRKAFSIEIVEIYLNVQLILQIMSYLIYLYLK